MKKEYGDYYLGLDIGTDSVGWSVTDKHYKLLKFNGKTMWGIRLFDSGNTAEERRTYRSARRRQARRVERIKLLQDLFSEEVSKRDISFFERLKDSRFYAEDKKIRQKNTIFNDVDYNDIDYHREYPTIYHLRKAFLDGKKITDVRLLYLAMANIIKKRGHFLFEGDGLESISDFEAIYKDFCNVIFEQLDVDFSDADAESIKECIKKKSGVTESCKIK